MLHPVSLFVFVLAGFSSYSSETGLNILSQYQNLHPFHETIKDPLPVEKCERRRRKSVCKIEIQMEDNIQKFHNLLSQTEDHFDVEEPGFSSTYIGQNYQMLKNFVSLHENLSSCSEDSKLWTKKGVQKIVDRFMSVESIQPCDDQKTDPPPFFFTGTVFSPESELENRILLESLNIGLRSQFLVAKKFKNQDLSDPLFQEETVNNLCRSTVVSRHPRTHKVSKKEENICSDFYENILRQMAQKAQKEVQENPESSFTSPEIIVDDVNQSVSKINSIFQRYNHLKNKISSAWLEEDKERNLQPKTRHTRQRLEPRIRQRRERELLELKKQFFEEYRLEFSKFHNSKAGILLQTNAVQSAINIPEVESLSPKFFGLLGFNEAVLETTDEFPLLNTIDTQTAHQAIEETFSRNKDYTQKTLSKIKTKQNKDETFLSQLENAENETEKQEIYNKYNEQNIENLKKLILTNSGASGPIISNHPEYAGVLCKTARSMAEDERNRMLAEASIYLTVGGGLTIASIMTLGGTLPITAIVAGTASAVAFTAGDFIYQKKESSNRQKVHEEMLNAYLSSAGGQASIDDMRKEWREINEVDYGATVTLGLGVADVMSIVPAVKAISFLKTTRQAARQAETFNTRISQNRKMLRSLIQDSSNVQFIRKLKNQYSVREVGEFLSFLGDLNSNDQKRILSTLKEVSRGRPLVDLSSFAQSDFIKGLFPIVQRQKFLNLVDTFQQPILPQSQRSVRRSSAYSSILSKITDSSHQSIVISAISSLSLQGKSQLEIMRSISNLLPVPDSMPSKELMEE